MRLTFDRLRIEEIVLHWLNPLWYRLKPIERQRQILQDESPRNVGVTLSETRHFLSWSASNIDQQNRIWTVSDRPQFLGSRIDFKPLRLVDQPSRGHVVVKRLLLFWVLFEHAEDFVKSVCVLEECLLPWFIGELGNAWPTHVLDQFCSLDCQPVPWSEHRGSVPCQSRVQSYQSQSLTLYEHGNTY